MLVTLTRAAWRSLVAQAAGHEREGGGLLIGKRTRYGNVQVSYATGLTHVAADDGQIHYVLDEIAQARRAVWEVYKPLESVGMWHTHPWPSRCVLAIANQISDDWDDPRSDVSEMLDGEIELIASTYPPADGRLKDSEWRKGVLVAGKIVRVEAWLRVKQGKIEPCLLKVR